LAGAKEMALSQAGTRTAEEAAQSYAKTQLVGREENLNISVEIDKLGGVVSVRVVEAWKPIFSEFVGAGMTPVSASATAKLSGSANICVLTLDGSSDSAFALNTGASVSAPDCALYSNSKSERGMAFARNTNTSSNLVCSAGGVVYSPGNVDPEPTTDCPQIADPLAGRPPPAFGPCVNVAMPIRTDTTLHPGRYCNGIIITVKSDVKFEPGDYVIEGGEFAIVGQGSVVGRDVGFYLKGPDAVLNFAGQSIVEFSGRIEGNMAGMVFFEDRDAPLGREHRIATLLTRELTGTIYLSRGRLLIDPKARVGEKSAYTAIIAHTLELRDGPELILNADYGASAVPIPSGLKQSSVVALSK
jgi:hypothetical protein